MKSFVVFCLNKVNRVFDSLWQQIKTIKYRPNKNALATIEKYLGKDHQIKSNLLDQEISADELVSLIRTNFIDKVGSRDLSWMIYGLIHYRKTGFTPRQAHSAYVSSYLKSSGLAQDLLHAALFFDPTSADAQKSRDSLRIRKISSSELASCLTELKQNGYSFLYDYLDQDLIADVISDVRSMRFHDAGSNTTTYIDPETPPSCNTVIALPEDLALSKSIN